MTECCASDFKLECVACKNGVSESDYCAFKPETPGCDVIKAAQKAVTTAKKNQIETEKKKVATEKDARGCLVNDLDLGFVVMDVLCSDALNLRFVFATLSAAATIS